MDGKLRTIENKRVRSAKTLCNARPSKQFLLRMSRRTKVRRFAVCTQQHFTIFFFSALETEHIDSLFEDYVNWNAFSLQSVEVLLKLRLDDSEFVSQPFGTFVISFALYLK